MNLTKVTMFLSRTELASLLKLDKSQITRWNDFGYVPEKYQVKVMNALKRRKRALDKAYNEVIK